MFWTVGWDSVMPHSRPRSGRAERRGVKFAGRDIPAVEDWPESPTMATLGQALEPRAGLRQPLKHLPDGLTAARVGGVGLKMHAARVQELARNPEQRRGGLPLPRIEPRRYPHQPGGLPQVSGLGGETG